MEPHKAEETLTEETVEKVEETWGAAQAAVVLGVVVLGCCCGVDGRYRSCGRGGGGVVTSWSWS